MPAFRQKEELQLWPWDKVFTKKKTNRATEQVFSFAGLPVARKTGELEPIYYADLHELGATTFTVNKFTLASMFSHELLKDNIHLPEVLGEAGAAAGESQSFIRAQAAASIFNRAFNGSYTGYDSAALCATHTMKDGTSYDNALTAASLTFDNLWSAINHFETAPVSHSGLYLRDVPKFLIYHPSYEKQVRALLDTTNGEPGTADNDKNTIRDYKLQPISCRFLSTSTNWFVLGSRAKKDLLWFTREGVQTDTEDDFDRMAVKFRSYQRFALGFRDFLWVVGNPGA
jgi:hypothetical protein